MENPANNKRDRIRLVDVLFSCLVFRDGELPSDGTNPFLWGDSKTVRLMDVLLCRSSVNMEVIRKVNGAAKTKESEVLPFRPEQKNRYIRHTVQYSTSTTCKNRHLPDLRFIHASVNKYP